MNPIAELALARALARGATPIPAAEVLPAAAPVAPAQPVRPAPTGPESRVLYLEGRRHAADIVLAATQTLAMPGGPEQVLANLRRSMQGKPASFAKGVAEIIELLEQEVRRG